MEILRQRGYDILYVRRPGAIHLPDGTSKTLPDGPDIVAVRNGRTVVVEAKGSANTVTLSSCRMRSTVGGGTTENSRDWLATNSDRYLNDLFASETAGHRDAARLLEDIAKNDGAYDAVFIGAGGAVQRFGRIDEAALEVTNDAGSVDFITTDNPDI